MEDSDESDDGDISVPYSMRHRRERLNGVVVPPAVKLQMSLLKEAKEDDEDSNWWVSDAAAAEAAALSFPTFLIIYYTF